jgi:hypothetical protein
MSLQRYHDLFISQVEVLEQVGVTIEDQSMVESVAAGNMRAEPTEADRLEAREMAMAIRFIRGTNNKYRSYVTHLRNSYLDGNDIYPTTLHQAYNILQRREMDVVPTSNNTDGVAFTNIGNTQEERNNNKDHITCYECGEKGHYANKCPKRLCNNDACKEGTGNGKEGNRGNGNDKEGTNCFMFGAEEEAAEEVNENDYLFHQQSKKSSVPRD